MCQPVLVDPTWLINESSVHHAIFMICLQAQRRWVEQQDEFVRRRRDHEMRMIAMEATEADRREEEIRRRIEGLDEQKRKNRSVRQTGWA